MGQTTDIAWADSTFNPWIGCQKVSEECDHCYAEDLFNKARFFDPQWARNLRDECADTGVLFFMKQMRNDGPIPDDLMWGQWPTPRNATAHRRLKGKLLDAHRPNIPHPRRLTAKGTQCGNLE